MLMSKTIIGMLLLSLLSASMVFAQQESGQVTAGTGAIQPGGKILAGAVPSYIINKSNNYIKSFVGNDYFDQYLTRMGNNTFQYETGEISYNVLYSYDIPQSAYLASPGPMHVSVSLDKDGNIIDYLGPRKPHTFSITKEKVIEIAKQNGLREPVIAEIDRVLTSNSIDGYVWVITGVVDQTTCKDIGGMQECLIPGKYIDVDDGSVIGTFNKSSLIREPGQSPIVDQQTSNSTFVIIMGIIVLLIIVLIVLYKNRYMER